jgi:hypothetical protein
MSLALHCINYFVRVGWIVSFGCDGFRCLELFWLDVLLMNFRMLVSWVQLVSTVAVIDWLFLLTSYENSVFDSVHFFTISVSSSFIYRS